MKKPDWKKGLFFTLGCASLGLAYVGLLMPGIPTVPFVLLAAFFYLRSSERMYGWLMGHRIFGRMARNFKEKKGSWKRLAWMVLLPSWGSVAVAVWLTKNNYWRVAVVVFAILISVWFVRFVQQHFQHPKGISENPR
jgi:uncharacterized membrane protein YbaN (DUF454 family)